MPKSGGGLHQLDGDWRTWWRWNRELFLAHEYVAGPQSGDGASWRPVRSELVERTIVPALQSALESAPAGREVHSAVLLALGLTLDGDSNAAIEASFRDSSRWVAENAAIALGLSHSPEAARTLGAVLAGDSDDTVGGRRLTDRGRAFTICSLALVAAETDNADVRRFAVSLLMRVVVPEKGEPVVGQSAVLGLAVLAEARPGLSAQDENLVEQAITWLNDDDLDVRVRAHVPRLISALSQQASDDVQESLVAALFAVREKREEMRAGVAQALGSIAVDDKSVAKKIVEHLIDAADSGRPFERRLAYIALGQRAGREGGTAAGKFLLRSLKRPKAAFEPWLALGFGLWGHEEHARGVEADPDRLRALRISLRGAKNPDVAAAWGLALGLSRDRQAADSLLERLDEATTTNQGFYALALGLANVSEAIPKLVELLPDLEHNAGALEDCTIARSLLGDPNLARTLLAGHEEACCDFSSASYLRSLARVRDARLVGPLVSTFERAQGSEAARAWAASALGRLAGGSPTPWTARFSIGLNYASTVPALVASDRSGLLDLN